ncbi:unnamed protein product [marine sediment metagenome]|uniref:ASCH domain-containing protein n=1 Tax=marine sediment metagenome TaxID=412755 RepID=X1VQ67_9ZZZZ
MIERLYFSTRVLGPLAAWRLETRQVTQTLRAESGSITNAILLGRVSAGDRLEVVLDGIFVGQAKFVSMDAVNWECINSDDANRGGFDTLEELEKTLKRAGYRFKPLNEYQLYRIQLSWLEEIYA